MILVKDITSILEEFAPPAFQENYDNSGLLVGSPHSQVKAILITLDVTREVLNEAIDAGANLIISHHPLIFTGLKRITGNTETERLVISAIKNDIAIYASHTNLDNAWGGLNHRLGYRLGLQNLKVLSPATNQLVKLATFAPRADAERVRQAMFDAGAGTIGDYDECSFNTEGLGTFRAGSNTNPFVGEIGTRHTEPESRIEVIVPSFRIERVVEMMLKAHPYQEVAYDIFPLANSNPKVGAGIIGELEQHEDEKEFLTRVKESLKIQCLKHSCFTGKAIKRVAICGGSGAFLLGNALSQRADAFITADLKYHNFFEAEQTILIADIGHYESEVIAKDIFYELITKKLPNFAVLKSRVNTNPINYL